MKFNIYNYGLAVFITLVASIMVGCREDLSTLDVNKIPGVEIDTTGGSTLSVLQFDTLKVSPKINTELDESNLSYEWKINIAPAELESEIIGTTRDLSAPITYKPTLSGYAHQLLLTITDNSTGLQYVMGWPVTIKNSIGQGLVVAETPDGVNTDISHIMSARVTEDYDGESIKHHIFSTINGHTLPGLTKQLRYTRLRGSDGIMMGITDNSIYTVKTLDYTFEFENEDLFFAPPEIKPQMLGALIQSDVYVGAGKIHSVWLQISNKFGLPHASAYTVPDFVALNAHYANNPAVAISFYEEEVGQFIYQSSVQSWGDRTMRKTPSVPGEPFNPTDLPGKINLAAGVTQGGEFLHLLKDQNSGNVALYILNDAYFDDDFNLVPPTAKVIVDLLGAPEIENAEHFVLLDDQNVMYYATKNKIYAVLFGGAIPQFSERYTTASGEEITTLQIYRQANYPYNSSSDPYIATNNKQLIMSTYDDSEGKVYILPMINTGVGNIDKPNIKTYGGFDRITAIAPQL